MKISRASFFLILMSCVIVSFLSTPVHAAKVGQKCSKAGVITGKGASKLTCIKKGKSLVWAKTPESVLGTAKMPIPMGTKFKISGIEFSISALNLNADTLICSGSSWNRGCTRDDNFKNIVDPESDTTWLTVEITASNRTDEIVRPSGFNREFFLVLSNGQLLNASSYESFSNNLDEVQLIPDGTGVGLVAFALPKTGARVSNLLVMRDITNLLKSADYYFEVKW